MPYPTGSDLATFLVAKGFTVADVDPLGDIMTGVCETWEEDTGFIPYLYGGAVTTRPYTGDGTPLLFLNAGICSSTGLVVEINDSAQTLDTDFWLRPSDAPGKSKPWTWIEFNFGLDTTQDIIEVTARFGYTETLEGFVKRALLAKGAAEWLRDMSDQVTIGGIPNRIKQGGVEYEFGSKEGGAYCGSLQTQFAGAYDRALGLRQAAWKVMA